jgi:hypothetical protein
LAHFAYHITPAAIFKEGGKILLRQRFCIFYRYRGDFLLCAYQSTEIRPEKEKKIENP